MLTIIISLISVAVAAFAMFSVNKAKAELSETITEVKNLIPKDTDQRIHVESDFFEVKKGSVHLKSGYKGLYVDGFISAGGKSETMEG